MTDAADRLEAMAARIRANKDDEFAGCVVVIPPQADEQRQGGDSGDAIEILLIDPARDAVNFWSTAKAKLELTYQAFLNQHQRPPLGFR